MGSLGRERATVAGCVVLGQAVAWSAVGLTPGVPGGASAPVVSATLVFVFGLGPLGGLLAARLFSHVAREATLLLVIPVLVVNLLMIGPLRVFSPDDMEPISTGMRLLDVLLGGLPVSEENATGFPWQLPVWITVVYLVAWLGTRWRTRRSER